MRQLLTRSDAPLRRLEDGALGWLAGADPRARASLARLAGEAALPGGLRGASNPGLSSSADTRAIEPSEACLPDAWLRLWKRTQLPDRIIAFHDDLAVASDAEAICGVVARHAARIVGAYQAVVLLPAEGDEAAGDAPALRIAGWWSNGAPPPEVLLEREEAPRAPGLVHAGPARDDATAGSGLAPLAETPGVATLAMVPVGRQGLLMLTERRAERIFTQDDWTVLATLATHAQRALDRVRTLEKARVEALVDPLTGLANRRHLEIVLQHAWAGAERGEGMAVILLDLDDFKGINDRFGHPMGDDLLRVVAEVLRTEVRGVDAVVRYGGDEFLVVLPRSGTDAARTLLERVSRRLEGWVGVTGGVAEHHPSYASPGELIEAADRDLYRRKGRR